MLELVGAAFGYRSAGRTVEVTAPVSLTVESGQIVALVGPSGVGKSTVLRTIASLVRPLSGDVRVSGEGFVRDCWFEPQSPVFLPFRDTLQNALASRELHRSLGRSDIDEAQELLARLGLGKAASADPRALSGGMQRRLGLARGLLSESAILLLDEPLAELDLRRRQDAERLIAERARVGGRSVLLASHDIDSVAAVADYALVLQSPLPARATVMSISDRFPDAADPPKRRKCECFVVVVADLQRQLWEQHGG